MAYPVLHIVTGPPGSGKSTWAEQKGLPIYDNDLGNLYDWKGKLKDAVVTVTAPSHQQKQAWLDRAAREGYTPKLYCIWLSRMEAHCRAEQRSERNGPRTFRWIEHWFKEYTRHPLEERILNERNSVSHAS